MPQKIRVGIIFGGKSVEHEVSIRSACNVYDALDKDKYEPILIGIDKAGHWHLGKIEHLENQRTSLFPSSTEVSSVALIPSKIGNHLIGVQSSEVAHSLDVVFPILHGPFGEDGTVQGLLKLLDLPFVGASVLGSAIGMDKDVMKRLLRDAGIPIADFVTMTVHNKEHFSFASLVEKLGLPFFMKPANTGSSVGISKVKNEKDYKRALELAFLYDHKVICERYIQGREIEFAVLGSEHPLVSLPGEIVPNHEFYSYEAKYLDENGAQLIYPASIEPPLVQKMQKIAAQTFQVLCCEMMARVDFFLTAQGEFYVNEINTIPGFTSISMYPKLMELSGVPYSHLIDQLVNFAIERHTREKKIQTSRL